VVPESLRAAGAEVDVVEAYRNIPAQVDPAVLRAQILSGELDVLTFASPSAVHNFFALLDSKAKARASQLVIAAVGKTTSQALESEGVTAQVIPERPGGPELVAALAEYMAQNQGSGE
jgi:uroporphyrinogen III methyltransferase/synthase